MLATIAILFGMLIYAWPRGAQATVPTASIAKTPAAATVPLAAPNPTATPDLPDPALATPPPVPNPDQEPSLEDMVATATPAVVAIESDSARGTGFFVRADAIVTNAHVVRGSTVVRLTFADGHKGAASVVSVPSNVDLALLRPAPGSEGRSVLELSSVTRVRPGEEVIAIGSALGVLQNTVTRGIVSAVRQDTGGVTLVQTDAAINPGNSGGPLLDRSGRVIGVNTMKVGSAAAIGFALAADHVRALLAAPNNGALPVADAAASSEAPVLAQPATEPDAAHARAILAYDLALRGLAGQADQIDAAWARFKRSCNVEAPSANGDREWFGLWNGRPTVRANVVDCSALTDDLLQATAAMHTSMSATEDAARRAGIYPGEARERRHKYRLDWDGWNR